MIGVDSGGASFSSGDSNLFLGHNAGDNITSGNSNICIGPSQGPAAPGAVNNATYIGSAGSSQTYITGIDNATSSGVLKHVMSESTNRLTSIAAMMSPEIALKCDTNIIAATTPTVLTFDGTITPTPQSYLTPVGGGPTFTQFTVNRTGVWMFRYAFYSNTASDTWSINLGIGAIPSYVTQSHHYTGVALSGLVVFDSYIIWNLTAGDIIQIQVETALGATISNAGSLHCYYIRADPANA